jgi:murein DD-endopeptidase MepM/ murein hydrolase activator NlpD
MDIRATCDGVEGGRFGENVRGPNDKKPHYGIDLLAESGTVVKSSVSGEVQFANDQPSASDFGKYVLVDQSGKDRLVMYAHLSSVNVETNDSVSMETKLGETGTTGNACDDDCSCGPAHLHLGVKEGSTWGNGTPKDPEETVLGTKFGTNGDPVFDSCN